MRVHPLAPVVALDIDGTLAAYHDKFRWFAEMYLQRPLRAEWTDGLKGDFAEALGLERAEYRRIKLAYRQGGMKRSLPLIDPAHTAAAVASLRAQGCQVWITTTRPWNRLDNVDPDTQFWIDHFVGHVDGLIYGEDKYSDLVDIVGIERVLCAYDDIPANIQKAEALGIRTLLSRGDHNAWWEPARTRFTGMASALNTMEDLLDEWVAGPGAALARTGSATGASTPVAGHRYGLGSDQPETIYGAEPPC